MASINLNLDPKNLLRGARESEKALLGLTNSAEDLNNSGTKAVSGFTSAVKALGPVIGALGLAAFFREAVSASSQFQASISELSAITGATGEDLEFLSDKAREFGASTTLSATQSAEAIKLIASAKPDLLESADALAAVTEEAIALAEASGSTLPEAANTLGSALNQFGAEADNASRFINVLAAGAKFGASSVAQTSLAIKQSGVVASNAGVSFEELNSAVQVLSTNAITGAEAGTALRNVLLILQTQTNDQFNPAIVGLSQALINLREASLSTTESAKLFGRENVVGASILIKNAESVDELTQKLTGTTTAYEQAATRTDNLQGDTLALSSATESLFITIGDKLTPAARVLVQGFTDLIRQFTQAFDIISSNTAATDTFRGVLVGLAATGKVVQLVFKGVGEVLGATVAAAVSIASGEFERAGNIMEDLRGGGVKLAEEFSNFEKNTLRELATGTFTASTAQKDFTERLVEGTQAVKDRNAAVQELNETGLSEQDQKRLSALEESLLAEEQQLQLSFERKRELILAADEEDISQFQDKNALLEELELQHQARLGDIEAQGILARRDFENQSNVERIRSSASFFKQLSQGVSQSSKDAFRINKVSALAEASIDGVKGVQKTLGAYPYPLNLGFAAAHALLAAKNVKQIANSKFGSGNAPPSLSTSGGTPVTPTTSLAGDLDPTRRSSFGVSDNQGQQRVTQITIQGDALALSTEGFREQVLPHIEEAFRNGDLLDLRLAQT